MLRTNIWYQFWAECRDRAVGMHPGMLQALQVILSSHSLGQDSCAATVVVVVVVCRHSSRSVPGVDI